MHAEAVVIIVPETNKDKVLTIREVYSKVQDYTDTVPKALTMLLVDETGSKTMINASHDSLQVTSIVGPNTKRFQVTNQQTKK